ncbi:MAG: apolipoprotein N-acyltransferase [Mariprofundaceae bacterium]|nr:apolipoprotein N-acyltransferase [Mariprofundaceae bacterium]
MRLGASKQHNRLPGRLRLLAALLCGTAMPFAFSPYDYKWLAIAALTGWILLLNGRGFALGYAFGLGWFGVGAWWLAPTFHTFGPLAWIWAIAAAFAVGAALAVFPALLAWLSLRLAGSRERMLLLLPLLAVGEEWVRGHIFTGLPWTPLGSLLLDTPAIGWAAWFGVYGATLLPVGLAAALAGVLISGKPARAFALLVLIIIACVAAPSPYMAEGKKHRVALVQASIPQQLKWDAGFLNDTMERYARLSREAAQRSDLIVWPEVAIPLFLERAPEWRQWLMAQMRDWGKPLLFGGLKLGDDGRSAYNGLYLFQPGVDELEFVGKRHLVPFGEYVPSWIPFLHALVPNIGDFKATGDSGTLPANAGRYGSLICYEAIFPEQGRYRAAQASVLVNVTNDAWYGRTPATWQHLQAARMRAVENGRYLLRAANTGVSAIIAPDGAVVQSMPWFEQGVVYGEYRESWVQTPYLRRGDMPLLALLLPLLIIVLYPRRLSR